MTTVVGIFPTTSDAERCARILNSRGVPYDEVIIAEAESARDHSRQWGKRNVCAAAATAWGWTIAPLIPPVAENGGTAATFFGAGVGAAFFAAFGLFLLAVAGPNSALNLNPWVTISVVAAFGAAAGACAASFYNVGVSHETKALAREAEIEHGVALSAHIIEDRKPDVVDTMLKNGVIRIRADHDAWRAAGWIGPHHVEAEYANDSTISRH